jgi:hypothetical protein
MKIQFFFLAVGMMLIALTFNACSSEDDSKGFGTCSEMKNVINKCGDELPKNLQDEYDACLSSAQSNEEEEICDGIISPAMNQCFLNSGICGKASLEECGAHFDDECGSW